LQLVVTKHSRQLNLDGSEMLKGLLLTDKLPDPM